MRGWRDYLKFHNWRMPLILLGILAALWAAWWHGQPKTYHLVARSTTADIALIPCRDGYLTQEGGNDFVLRDWVKGRERWRVHTGYKLTTGTYGPYWSVGEVGDIFAAIIPMAHYTPRVQVWRNGALIFDQVIDELHSPKGGYRIRVLNDGRVVVWQVTQPGNPAVVIQDGAIIARGNLTWTTHVGLSYVAPDGSFSVAPYKNGFLYAPLTIRDGRLIAAPRYNPHAYLRGPCCYPLYGIEAPQLAHGMLLTPNDKIYGPDGVLPGKGKWATSTITPGGEYLLQTDGARSRVYAPTTGDEWSYAIKNGNLGGDVTMDGRYALAYFKPTPPRAITRVSALLRGVPDLGRAIPNTDNLVYIALYERPGTLRALMRVDPAKWHPGFTEDTISWWFPSPDGHGYVINMHDGNTGECILFRW